jgi:hypothetical protein
MAKFCLFSHRSIQLIELDHALAISEELGPPEHPRTHFTILHLVPSTDSVKNSGTGPNGNHLTNPSALLFHRKPKPTPSSSTIASSKPFPPVPVSAPRAPSRIPRGTGHILWHRPGEQPPGGPHSIQTEDLSHAGIYWLKRGRGGCGSGSNREARADYLELVCTGMAGGGWGGGFVYVEEELGKELGGKAFDVGGHDWCGERRGRGA